MGIHQHDGAIVPSSSSSSGHQIQNYHVFLSFHGEDTRKTFTDHLYTALVDAGFRTFRDDDAIPRGEDVTSELRNAIRCSRSSIIVFSKGYASSRWCLEELSLILQCRREYDHVVVPVFYDVDPSDVRKQAASFGKAFKGHERKYGKVEVKKWRAALREAGDLAGMVLKNQKDGHESKFIKKIIKVIGDKLHRAFVLPNPYLVGIDSIARKLNQWLQDGTNTVQIAALCGMGGIGKTAIAKFIYNMNLKYFDGSSFLGEVRETAKRTDGLVHLQKKLLSDILRGKDEKIWSVDEGIIKIQDALCNKRILLVVDDVDHIEQINAIFGMRNWFHPGSKIIITTRHGHLLRTGESYIVPDGRPHTAFQNEHAFCKVYNVKELNQDNSCRLFSWYAFGQDYPVDEYAVESTRIVDYCGGLPLALKVLGSSLRGQSIDIWGRTADRLQAIPDSQVMEKLKISYDSLQDDHDRNLFLHIVCFFIGTDKDKALRILDECEFFSLVGIDNLIDRCVLSIDEHNKLRVHQLLRDMGREIVRLESPRDPGKRSRLWHNKDSLRVLVEKSGTRSIEGIILDMHMFKANASQTSMASEYDRDTSKNPVESMVELEADTFLNTQCLTILHLKYVQLRGSFDNIPKTLKWLSWKGFPHNSIPDILDMKGVVALDMSYSNLKEVWTKSKFIDSVRILDLRHSYGLTETPDFSLLPNLERLVLKYCTSLVEIHESIRYLQKLVILNLKQCKNLKKLPGKFVALKSLETLDISGCISIRQMPNLENLESLKVFFADGLDISQIFATSSTDGDTKSHQEDASLEIIDPRQSPETSWAACLPTTLVSLSLSMCNLSDGDFPPILSRLSSLQKLDLSRNRFKTMPDFIRHLRLEDLNFDSCEELEFIEGLPRPMQLAIRSCTSLKRITYKRTERTVVDSYQYLECESLVEVEDEFKLEPLESVNIKLIAVLGLHNFDLSQDLRVTLACSYWTTCSTLPLQGLYENGAFSVFIPGEEVPDWFTNYVCDGSTMLFSVPAYPNLRVVGLNICGVYTLRGEWSFAGNVPLSIQVINVTKRLTWLMSPSCFGVPQENEYFLWFCHLLVRQADQLEEDDQVYISIDADEGFDVKECGLMFVLDEISTSHPSESIEDCRSSGNAGEVDSSRSWFKLGIDFEPYRGPLELEENNTESDAGDEDVEFDNQTNDRRTESENPKPKKRKRLLLKLMVGVGVGVVSFAFVSRASFFMRKHKRIVRRA